MAQDDPDPFDLDRAPPSRTADDLDSDVEVEYGMTSEAGNVVDFDGSASFTLWRKSGAPDYADCALLPQGNIKVTDVRAKSVLCVRTSEERVAVMRVTRVAPFKSLTFSVTVWNAAPSR